MTDQISSPTDQPNYIQLAADIVSAYVSRNAVPAVDLPGLIGTVHTALRNVSGPAASAPMVGKPIPAVAIKKSITPNAIISLEDGKSYKSMKRHLTRFGMTPHQYREKWGLPKDYPMVAPSYAAQRSQLAKTMGLGQQRRKTAAKRAETAETISSPAPKTRGRKKAS